MKKRGICFFLALLMLLTTVSCSETKENSDSDKETETSSTASAEETTEETEAETELTDYEKRQLISDNLPEVKYDGQEFRVLVPIVNNSVDYRIEIVADELTGDACNDAVYNRNLNIENRFETKITGTEIDSPWDQVKTMATAGTSDYDIVSIYDYKAYTPLNAKAVINWMEVPNIDTTQVWYNQLANDGATINNRLFAICSDLSTTSLTLSYSIFFNTEIMENYGYSSSALYDLVKEGTWTFDKFSEIVSGIYEDRNGNGTKDKDDFYGFACYIENTGDVWAAAFDQPIVSTDNDEIQVVLMCDKTVAILEKLSDFHQNNQGFFRYTSTIYEEEKYFLNELTAMAPMRFIAAYTTLRDMEAQYSILPYPKWNEEQENYYTNADDKFSVFVIPLSSYGNLEFIGTIFEALSAESYKTVYPEYYDTALKGKYSSESETAEMVDIIVAGRNFDFSYQFGESYFARMCYLIRDMLKDNETDLASKYKSKEKVLQKSIENKLNDLYFGD